VHAAEVVCTSTLVEPHGARRSGQRSMLLSARPSSRKGPDGARHRRLQRQHARRAARGPTVRAAQAIRTIARVSRAAWSPTRRKAADAVVSAPVEPQRARRCAPQKPSAQARPSTGKGPEGGVTIHVILGSPVEPQVARRSGKTGGGVGWKNVGAGHAPCTTLLALSRRISWRQEDVRANGFLRRRDGYLRWGAPEGGRGMTHELLSCGKCLSSGERACALGRQLGAGGGEAVRRHSVRAGRAVWRGRMGGGSGRG